MGTYTGNNANNYFRAYPDIIEVEIDIPPKRQSMFRPLGKPFTDTIEIELPWTLSGLGGDDTLIGSKKNDSIDGGTGGDRLEGRGGRDQIEGGSGNDHINGGSGHDYLNGGNGLDLIFGASGNDIIHGADGDDTLYGGVGNDTLFGSKGNDSLSGGYGRDYLTGGFGNDKLVGGFGSDELKGEHGDDILVGYGGRFGEIDVLEGDGSTDPDTDPRDVVGADIFVLGNSLRAFYLDDIGHAIIKDFDHSDGDKIRVHGKQEDYRLSYGDTDTVIEYKNNVIGITAGTTNLQLDTDFIFLPGPIASPNNPPGPIEVDPGPGRPDIF